MAPSRAPSIGLPPSRANSNQVASPTKPTISRQPTPVASLGELAVPSAAADVVEEEVEEKVVVVEEGSGKGSFASGAKASVDWIEEKDKLDVGPPDPNLDPNPSPARSQPRSQPGHHLIPT